MRFGWFIRNYPFTIAFIILLIITLVCVCKRKRKAYIWLLAAALVLYLISNWGYVRDLFSLIFSDLSNPISGTVAFSIMLIIFILLVLSLIFTCRRKYKISVWLLSVTLFLYIISHWNMLFNIVISIRG